MALMPGAARARGIAAGAIRALGNGASRVWASEVWARGIWAGALLSERFLVGSLARLGEG